MFALLTYPNFAVSGFIIASCIRRRVTSNGYENDWARAPAKPPHKSFAGMPSTSPPTKESSGQAAVPAASKSQRTCIPLQFVARVVGRVLHARVLQDLEAVERKAGVRNHSHERRHETSVQRTHAAFLLQYAGRCVQDAGVLVLARHLKR